jgi:hypothetical protein
MIRTSQAKNSFNAHKNDLKQRNAWNDQYNDPYYLFVLHWIPQERDRIETKEGKVATDINTIAYRNVRETWQRRGFWDPAWDTFPGTKWPWEYEKAELEHSTHIPKPPPRYDGHQGLETPLPIVLAPTPRKIKQEPLAYSALSTAQPSLSQGVWRGVAN